MATISTDTGALQPTGAPALLREVARLHVRAQRATLACDATTASTCTILTALGREASMTLAQLARRLRLNKGWTSRAVDQLVEQGLIDKAAGDSDRRTIALSLTRAGRTEHRRIEAVLNQQATRVIGRIPAAQRVAVSRALALLHQAYEAELADERVEQTRSVCEAAS